MLKIGELKFDELWRDDADGSTEVRMVTKPDMSWLPTGRVGGKLEGSALEFHDIIRYRPDDIAAPPYRIYVRTESPFLGDKLNIQLTLTIEEVEKGVSCRQVLEGVISVRMFGLGRIVEAVVNDSLTNVSVGGGGTGLWVYVGVWWG